MKKQEGFVTSIEIIFKVMAVCLIVSGLANLSEQKQQSNELIEGGDELWIQSQQEPDEPKLISPE